MLFFSFLSKRSRPQRRTQVNRRRNKARNQFNFGRLEPRQLLAGVSAELNLVTNGDFSTATGGTLGMFDQANVDGWNVADAGGGQMINLFSITAGGRGNVMDLDSTGAIFDSVFQDVDTLTGEEYLLSFELRERPNTDTGLEEVTNDVEVFWDGESLGTFRGISHWQTITLSVTGGSADTTRLEFREVVDTSTGSDGRGPMIDNVCVANVTEMTMDNGSFEAPTNVSDNGTPLTYRSNDFTGWTALGPDQFRTFKLNRGLVGDGSPVSATHGSDSLFLDGSANNVDRVFQTLDTTANANYFVTFDMRSASNQVVAENELRVRWNEDWAATFHGNQEWQSFGIFVSATSDSTRLVFREPGGHLGDGQGPLIDNVRIYMVDNTTADLGVDLNGGDNGNDHSATFTEDAGATDVMNNQATLKNDNGSDLTGMTLRITNPLDGNAETLAVDVGSTSIASNYDSSTGTLTLSGTASVDDYQTVLRTLTYNNTSQDPDETDRTIHINSQDGIRNSETSVLTVSVTAENDTPVLESIANVSGNVGEQIDAQANATDADDTDLTYSVSFTGDAIGTGDNEPTVSNTGLVSWNPSRSGIITVTVTATDGDGAKDSTSFQMTANIEGDVPLDFAPFSGNRQLSDVTPSLRNGVYTEAPAMTIDVNKTYRATLTTADGDMVFDLFPGEAPLTVNNFVNLANDGYYDGLTFHRVIDGFVAQGGDPLGTGSGGPGYSFADEFHPSRRFVGSGVLAMANSGANTNGSQFFITFASQTHLNDAHTIFGQLSSGNDVLNAITRRVDGNATPAEIIYRVTITEI